MILPIKKCKDYMSVVVDQMTHMPIASVRGDRNGEALDNSSARNPLKYNIYNEL